MKQLLEQLYEDLQKDLQHCKDKRLVFEKQIESCAQTAMKYLVTLQERLKTHVFESCSEKIEFFKKVKPLFTSEIEYYNLLYHSVLFKPLDPERAKFFWRREAGRLEKFITENGEFVDYYNSGATDRDEQFFRCFQQEDAIRGLKVYDIDPALTTTGDGLIAIFMALKRYQVYALEQIRVLEQEE